MSQFLRKGAFPLATAIHVHKALSRAKYFLIGQENHEFDQLKSEQTCNYIVTMICLLSWEELCSNFRPLSITGKSDEQIRPTIMTHMCHGILCSLMHTSWPSSESGWQDNQLASITGTVIINCTSKMSILIYSDFYFGDCRCRLIFQSQS